MRVFALNIVVGVVLLSVISPFTYAKDSTVDVESLFNLPFSDLMQTEVVTASKHAQPLSTVPAATYVISQEQIRRSGANTIPELLRMVPGLNVAQLDANKWAISARGFNRLYARHLLVMIDGRSVYSPLFSGVHWDSLDLLLEDVERIEVVRGPGAALWGANAVNGVINILTKRSGSTQGALVSIEAGSEHNILSARYGGGFSDRGNYRIYMKARETDHSLQVNSEEDARDGWKTSRVGFRADLVAGVRDNVMLQGDYYRGDLGATLNYTTLENPPSYQITETRDTDASAGNLLFRWTRSFSSTSEMVWQIYYDNIVRKEIPFRERHDSYDVDMQHRFALTPNQSFTWGINYRYIRQETDKSFRFSFVNDKETVENGGVFVQDEISAFDHKLSVIIGSKFDYFEYTGLEVQPNLKLAWKPKGHQTYWASVAKAVRSPSRIDEDAEINVSVFPSGMCSNGNLCVVRLLGDSDIESEKVLAYEMGFRGQNSEFFSYDVSLFYNKYSDILDTKVGSQFPVTDEAIDYEVLPRQFINGSKGSTKGLELATTWQPITEWRMSAGVTLLEMKIQAGDGFNLNDESPEKQYQFQSFYNISRDLEFDVLVYYVDGIRAQYQSQTIDDYVRVDTRIGWSPGAASELVFGVRNLTDDRHQELGNIPFIVATQVERNVYVKWTLTF